MESLAESMPQQESLPRFGDGSINLRELMRSLAEDVINAVMDAEADQLCAGGRKQPQRLPRAQSRHVRGRHHDAHTQAQDGQLLPRGRRRAVSVKDSAS